MHLDNKEDAKEYFKMKDSRNPAYVNAAYIANTKINNASNIRSNTSTVQYQTLEALNNVKLIELKDLNLNQL